MRKTIRLTESELKNMISESVKRVLNEQEEYDWSFVEEDPENTKSYENDISWDEKNAADAKARDEIAIWDIDGAPDGWFGDFPQYNTNQGADYDSGYEKMYGDRDINDEYFSDSDYRFKNDEWEWDLSPEDRKGMVDDRFDKDSVFNKAYTESRIHRIVKESVNKILKKL